MERNVTMAEISDGKLYSRDDMVKAGCDDCWGCSACCHGMGNSIVLDPYDVYRLTALRGDTLEHLLKEKKVEWNVVDGQILPNLILQSQLLLVHLKVQDMVALTLKLNRCLTI